MEDYIFHFNDQRALQIQSDGNCHDLYSHFAEVIGKDAQEIFGNHFGLETLAQRIKHVRQTQKIRWMAEYGCAIVVTPIDVVSTTLSVVGLDKWQSRIHASIHGRESTAFPDVDQPAFLELGTVPASLVETILQGFDIALSRARNKDERETKNHKTPSFIWAKLRDVLVENGIISDNNPKIWHSHHGGTTDVGIHTRCTRRNTSFPLVASVYNVLLNHSRSSDNQDFSKAMSIYFLHHLRTVQGQVAAFDPRKIDRVFTVLRVLRSYIEKVNDTRFQAEMLRRVKVHHEALRSLKPLIDDSICTLPSWESISEELKHFRSPNFPELPEVQQNVDIQSQMARARADAKENLEWTGFLSQPNFEVSQLEQQEVWLLLSWLNNKFWSAASDLSDPAKTHSVSTLRKWTMVHSEATKVAQNAAAGVSYIMSVDLKSCQTLAVWIAYCWAHRTAEEQHPIYQRYSAALDPRDLRFLALEDKLAVDALGHVRCFLEQHQSNPRYPFRDAEDTLDLATNYSLESPSLSAIYESEKMEATKRIEQRYEQILNTQKSLQELDEKLREAKDALEDAEQSHAVSSARDYYFLDGRRKKVYKQSFYDSKDEKDKRESAYKDLKAQVNDVEMDTPSDLRLSLPEVRTTALQWLFFFYMPQAFIDVLQLAHHGQSLLWDKIPSSDQPKTNLFSWFMRYKVTAQSTEELNVITLASNDVEVPSGAQTKTIRVYNKNTGVVFPHFRAKPFRRGGDPFSNVWKATDRAKLFTELLPHYGEKAQELLVLLPEPSSDRGNKGPATKNKKPDWLRHEEYLAFAALRAFPRLQLRQLLVAITDNMLPFGDDCVDILVRQSLYQVGEKGWKRDLVVENPLVGFAAELTKQAELLRAAPNNSDKLLIFCLVSSFLGQYNSSCRQCALNFSSVAKSLGDGVKEEIKESECALASLYWKQTKLYGCALLCHSVGHRGTEELLEILKILLLFKSASLYATEFPECKCLVLAVQKVMAHRIHDVIAAVSSEPDYLTTCFGYIVEGIPQSLTWKEIQYDNFRRTACFEAEDTGHVYFVNVLNGTLLVDGVPPGFLPSSVIRDPLYKRIFGSRNFECIVVGPGFYRTASIVNGEVWYYFKRFRSDLRIIECDPTVEYTHEGWLLLSKDSLDVSELLRENHSHWYSYKHEIVAFRPISFKSRAIIYLMTKEATYAVPDCDRTRGVDFILTKLSSYSKVLLQSSLSGAARILSRIESLQFVHITAADDSSELHFSMPRLGLEFRQREDRVYSKNLPGFSLKADQQFKDTLPGITDYLVLRDKHGNEKVLMPLGKIASNGTVSRLESWDSQAKYSIFDVHPRFRNLVAKDSMGRLHLAGLYAATSCCLFDERTKKTGATVATALVRQCWTNEPLTEEVTEKLIEVSEHSNFSCTLRLTCSWLWANSQRVSFLYERESSSTSPESYGALKIDPMAVREYRENSYADSLLATEEFSLLGTQQSIRSNQVVDLLKSKTKTFVEKMETSLKNKLLSTTGGKAGRAFPLVLPCHEGGLAKRISDDLVSSWEEVCSKPNFGAVKENELFNKYFFEVTGKRERQELHILKELHHQRCIGSDLAQVSGEIQHVSSLDMLSLLLDENVLEHVNPSIKGAKALSLRRRILEWCLLCILEDKLCRIRSTSSEQDLVVELESIRAFRPSEHIEWIIFEVEQGIQIRPYQYAVVKQLLDDRSAGIQLNMGQGKTRVLVPMLIMELAKPKNGSVRINMLASLINSFKEFYRSALTASVLNIHIFTLPFMRQLELTKETAGLIVAELNRCRTWRACLLMTPQHRNSLLLKQNDANVFLDRFDGLGLDGEIVDVYDEHDAALDHSFQLVYALGDQHHLPEGQTRWLMFEALLELLSFGSSSEICAIRDHPKFMHSESRFPGSFPNLRFLTSHQRYCEQNIGTALCKELIKDPPHEFLWMKGIVADNHRFSLLVKIMTDKNFSEASESIRADTLFSEYESDILAARGCIAYGLLHHCLTARHRVNYGVSLKKMAVPFSATDTPKARADYSHPDVAIIYTCLSYYHEGLSRVQFEEALRCLQTLGPTAQETIFKSWIDSVRDGIEPTQLQKFDSFLKIDVDNEVQRELLYGSFHLCMKTISFWMNNFVFPLETHVFPKRRVSSAWNLTDSGTAIGFSGTDDNRFLLPFGITQVLPNDPNLRATNGDMIDRILTCTKDICLLNDHHAALWMVVLKECFVRGVQALVDVGGLMAGVSTSQAAIYMSDLLDSSDFRGCVYFDIKSGTWYVYEFKSEKHEPLQTSSVREAECFVYFDESRCRGSDMKLPEKACALVTLEPRLTKDRFLQGCARMRKLRPDGQSIFLAGTSETLSESSTVKSVLEKVIQNTAQRNEKGVFEFYQHGMNYINFPEPLTMDVSLEAMYSSAVSEYESVKSFLDATMEVETSREQNESTATRVQKLRQYCRDIGGGMRVQVGQLSAECERELENEQQQEEEEEMEFEEGCPRCEVDWDFSLVFSSEKSDYLTLCTAVFRKVKDLIEKHFPPLFSAIKWSDKLLCTENFWLAVELHNADSDLSTFMRPVNSFLALPDGRVVLLSEYETNHLLPYWWDAEDPPVKLHHLALAVSGKSLDGVPLNLSAEVMASLKLFRGYVTFTEEELAELTRMFPASSQTRTSIQEVLHVRDRLRFLDRSTLDRFSLTHVRDG